MKAPCLGAFFMTLKLVSYNKLVKYQFLIYSYSLAIFMMRMA